MFDRIDAFTRPAAIGIALFIALVLLGSARTDLRARLAALSAAGTAAYLVCSTSRLQCRHGAHRAALHRQ